MLILVVLQIIQGQKDPRVEPAFTKHFHEEAQAADKTLLEYDEAYHQLFQDRPQVTEKALNDLTDWLSAHV